MAENVGFFPLSPGGVVLKVFGLGLDAVQLSVALPAARAEMQAPAIVA